jgi:hypothetical protein
MATISDENLQKIKLNTIIVAAFGIIATTTGKTSFAITLYRITAEKWMKYFLIFVIITVRLSMTCNRPSSQSSWAATENSC